MLSNIRPSYIKNTAREMVEQFPDLFTLDFETNKEILDEKYEIYSHQIRNKIAGYIITVLKTKGNDYEPVRLLSKENKDKRKKKK